MISILIDAALRSLIVGLIVALGMRVFAIRNVVVRKTAMGLVLLGALAMPLLMPVAIRFHVIPVNASAVLPAHPMTLLQELQARLQAKSGSANVPKLVGDPLPAPNPPQFEKPSNASSNLSASRDVDSAVSNPQAAPAHTHQGTVSAAPVRHRQSVSQSQPRTISPWSLAVSIYLAVSAVLLLRLLLGLAVTLRLWFNATPIAKRSLPHIPVGLRLRTSSKIGSPMTIGSAILVPADYETWDTEKLSIVLAHERSHIRQGDFYLQVLAGIYAAFVWFSPLGWWLKRELADLAEAISDRAGIKEARSRTSYAQILLEFAAAPRPAALGVAMARPGSLSRRIERLLNEHTFHQSFAGGKRALFTFAIVPAVLFGATAMVRVQAAPQHSPAPSIQIAAAHSATPALEPDAAYPSEELSTENIDQQDIALADTPDASASFAAAPEPEAAPIAAPEIASQAAPNLFPVPAVPRAIAAQSESGNSLSFDRTLSVSGETQLFVATGSGNIHLTPSSASQIQIHARIHVSRQGSEEQARQIAANPPIEQTGNIVRIGQQHEEHWRGISIDYDVQAPAGSILVATTGSGDLVDEGVGKNAKLHTGSGNIHSSALEGPFEVKTGSGDIVAEQTGQGDVQAETGSGNIEIKDIHGSFHGRTGSGDIKASGTPSQPWTLETGSGNIEISAGNAPMTLEASTGSGSVTTEHEMLVKGSLDHHHVSGNLNGGGPLVRVHTGSGDVRIH